MARRSKDIRLSPDELAQACDDIATWRRTGRLPENAMLRGIAAEHFVPEAGDDESHVLSQAEHYVLMTAAASLSSILADPGIAPMFADRTFGLTGPSDGSSKSNPGM